MIQTYFEYAPKCLRASVRAAEENMQRCVICSAFFLGPAFSFRAVYDSFFRSISKNGKILPYKNDDYIFFLRYCSETYLFEVLRSLKKSCRKRFTLAAAFAIYGIYFTSLSSGENNLRYFSQSDLLICARAAWETFFSINS